MLSSENSDLYEVTCIDCHSLKSYFTAQGVGYFKLKHDGHRISVKEPSPDVRTQAEAQDPSEEDPAEGPIEVLAEETDRNELIRLENLVVDVVDEANERLVKVYGIGGSQEKFSKEFNLRQLGELNLFLETGLFVDAKGMSYGWSHDGVDLSTDVVKLLDEAPEGVAEELRRPQRSCDGMVQEGVGHPSKPKADDP